MLDYHEDGYFDPPKAPIEGAMEAAAWPQLLTAYWDQELPESRRRYSTENYHALLAEVLATVQSHDDPTLTEGDLVDFLNDYSMSLPEDEGEYDSPEDNAAYEAWLERNGWVL